MKIIIFSGYNNGFGDLSFGRKLAGLLQKKYPNADIIVLTSPADSENFKREKNSQEMLRNFNENARYPVIQLDVYEQERTKMKKMVSPDLLVVGPVVNFERSYVDKITNGGKTVPIVAMTEHDFDPGHLRYFKEDLIESGYFYIKLIPTGLNTEFNSEGIFIQLSQEKFNKDDIRAKIAVFNDNLLLTRNTILMGKSVKDYVGTTTTSVSYSHNNAKRLIAVHTMVVEPEKNVDLIVLGESDKKDKLELNNRAQYLLSKGFSRVIYQELDKPAEILAQSDKSGPVYRIIHTGQISPDEARNLRKISDDFGGATGDQSYAEAITSNSTIVYETFPHKRDLVRGMVAIAEEVDPPPGKLSRAIHLLAHSKTEQEFEELAGYLKDPEMDKKFVEFRMAVLRNNLTEKLPDMIAAFMQEVEHSLSKQTNSKGKTKLGILDKVKELFSSKSDKESETTVVKKEQKPVKIAPSGSTSAVLMALGGPNKSSNLSLEIAEDAESEVESEQELLTVKGKEPERKKYVTEKGSKEITKPSPTADTRSFERR